MIRLLAMVLFITAMAALPAAGATVETYQLLDGGVLTGEPVAFSKDGLAVKKADGNFSLKVPWTNFTQSAIKKLVTLPKARPFVQEMLDIEEEEEIAKKAAQEIHPKPVPRLPRPDPKAGYGMMFASPVVVTLFILLFVANLYAGYEIAAFRNYPIALVCGVSFVAPVIGPIAFLCLPTHEATQPEEEIAPETATPETAHATAAVPATHAPAASAPTASAASPAAPQVFQRGQTTFNRRFFETKLSGFLRVVPGEAEKDMVLFIKSARGEHSGSRIVRVMPNDLSLLTTKNGASAEVIIPFAEINELQIRHKDA